MATIVIQVKVQPQSRASALDPAADGTWRARLKSAPLDGRANDELVALVARHFGCRKADVSITAGVASRTKRVRIENATPDAR
jgi:uncharacterized protein